MIPKWHILKLVYGKFANIAMLSLAMLPLLAEAFGWFGLPFHQFKVPVTGAILYLISCLIYSFSCPERIKANTDSEEYQKFCYENRARINLFSEFEAVNKMQHEKALKYFTKREYLYPLSAGLAIAENESIRVYSDITYTLLDNKYALKRAILSCMFLSSIICMEALIIQRIVQLFTIQNS